MSDPAIRLSAVSKAYGAGPQASQALANLDLEVRRGAFVSLMGPSGSGKTTLLNLIAGLDMPDTGEVVVEGIRLAGLADHKLADLRLEKIGFIFQAFNLIPALTVEENVGLFLEFAGRSKAEVRRMTAEALQQVGIRAGSGATPASCPAASNNASPSRARSSAVHRSCSPMSPREISTRTRDR